MQSVDFWHIYIDRLDFADYINVIEPTIRLWGRLKPNAVAAFQDVGGTDDAAAARPLLLAGGGPAEELEGEAQVAEGVAEEAAAAAGAIVIGGLILRPIHRFHPPPPPPPPPATVGLGFHAMQCECLRIGFVLAPKVG